VGCGGSIVDPALRFKFKEIGMKHSSRIESNTKSWIAAPLAASVLIGLLLVAPIALRPELARSQAVHLVEVDLKIVGAGYRTSKLLESAVYNDTNEKIGELDDIILSTDGKASFAILEVGGFLGIGERLVALPFESLKIDKGGKKIVLPGGSKSELERLAEFKYTS
jgi:hypothetical protein